MVGTTCQLFENLSEKFINKTTCMIPYIRYSKALLSTKMVSGMTFWQNTNRYCICSQHWAAQRKAYKKKIQRYCGQLKKKKKIKCFYFVMELTERATLCPSSQIKLSTSPQRFHSKFWVGRAPQGSIPALKWMAHEGIKPTTQVSLAPWSHQLG